MATCRSMPGSKQLFIREHVHLFRRDRKRAAAATGERGSMADV